MTPSGRALPILVLGGLLLLTVGIAAAFVVSKVQGGPLPVYGEVGGFQLVDQSGQVVTMEDLEGSVWVAGIIFTRCPMICAVLSRGMSELQGKLPGGKPVKLVLLTADPVFDTPAVLKEYGNRFGAREGQWIFLTGERDEIYRLALQGLKLSVMEKEMSEVEIPNDFFIHSGKFVLVDQRGRIRGWFDGEEPESRGKIPGAIRKLLREKSNP